MKKSLIYKYALKNRNSLIQLYQECTAQYREVTLYPILDLTHTQFVFIFFRNWTVTTQPLL